MSHSLFYLTPVSDPPIDNAKNNHSIIRLSLGPSNENQLLDLNGKIIRYRVVSSDFEENRLMQFSVRLSNNVNFDTITDISVSLVSLEGTTPSVEYTGNIEIDEFIEVENEKIALITHLSVRYSTK